MPPLNHLPLVRGLLRNVAGARREMAGIQTSELSTHTALRSSTSGISISPQVQSPPSRSPPVLRRHARPSARTDGVVALKLYAYRKRPLGTRALFARKSDADNVASSGGEHGDINTGSSSGSASSTCWKCNSPVGSRKFFCQCGAAQLLDGRLNYFEMFDCPPLVFLDLKKVEKSFKDMQRAFHPDLFASKSPEEQEISAANSATANKAYQTLVQPMSRVKYLMRLLGSTALEEEGAGDDDRTAVPMDFLMEIMEIRESIERCATAEDAEAILSETKAAADACLRSMDEALRAGGGKEELSDAAVRLRYLYRIEDEALRVMHRLEDGHGNPSAA